MNKKQEINNLNTINKKLIEDSLEVQKEIGWDYYKEREFVENLFCQRFNYFLIVYSVFITAAASVKTVKNLIIVLILAIILTTSIWLTIYRAFAKLIINLKILHQIPKNGHVFQVINNELKSYHWIKKLWGVNDLIGIYIPVFCILTLIAGLIFSILGYIEPFNN